MTMLRPFLLLLVVSTVLCKSFVIQPGIWNYNNHPIAYEQAQLLDTTAIDKKAADASAAASDTNNDPPAPILLLNGFGVGSFHQHRLISSIMNEKELGSHTIYTIDYLGQGKSWPKDCNDGKAASEQGLQYSGSTWVDQIIQFIDNVIVPGHNHKKLHIVGNSVGGHLAVFIAAARPDLIESICLLNATPVWGLNLPGWTGHLPAPAIPRWIGRYLFDRIRDLDTIEAYLENAYSNTDAFDKELMQQILSCTDGQGGHAAFASILWSPPIQVKTLQGETVKNFDACLSRLECDVLLLFGSGDPWCKPAFARRMLKSLATRPALAVHRYVELSNIGHCPNHEAPTAVAHVLQSWIGAVDRRPEQLALLSTETETIRESWGETTARERRESEIQLSTMDRIATTFV
jgi:pimeloyl-ACP methyl ester carboxylesterase